MIIALWVILVLLLVWISLSELPAGWDGHAPLPYLIALSPFAWIGITAVAIWSGCLREWPLMACAIVGLIASLLRKTAYYMNDLKTPNTGELIARKLAEKRESENLTISSNSAAVENLANGHFNVFTLNCRYGEANAHEIVNTVRTNDIAVLALQEMSPDLVTELHDAGLDDLLPFHQFGDPSSSDNGGFNGLWLRVEPAEQTPTGVPIPAADVPTVTLPVTSTFNITFASAHPKSATQLQGLVRRHHRAWRAGEICEQGPGPERRRLVQQSRNCRAHGRSQLEHRAPELPRAARERLPRRRPGRGARGTPDLPELAQMAAHCDRPHSVHRFHDRLQRARRVHRWH